MCTPSGLVLERHQWLKAELREALPSALKEARRYYGVPVVLTGRTEASWPQGLLEEVVGAGISVDLFGGRPVGKLLRLERKFREVTAYRAATLLATVYQRRLWRTPERPRSFVLNWCVDQALRRIEELMVEDSADSSAAPWLAPKDRGKDWSRCIVSPRSSSRPMERRGVSGEDE